MKKDRANIVESFGENSWLDGVPDELQVEAQCDQQTLRYKARFRALAQALSAHPLADRLANSIDTLRRIGGEEDKNS